MFTNDPHAKLRERMNEWFPEERNSTKIGVVHRDEEPVALIGYREDPPWATLDQGFEALKMLGIKTHLPAFAVTKDEDDGTYFPAPINLDAQRVPLKKKWMTREEFEAFLRALCRV